VGPRAGLDRCGKSRHHRDSIPGPSSPYPVAIPTELPGPLQYRKRHSMKQKCRSPGHQITRAKKFRTVASNNFRVLSIEIALRHHSGAENSEMAARLLKNLFTPEIIRKI
jgi:hypothetical protein